MKQHVAEIVAAYVRKNRVGASELPELIASVSQTLAGLREAPAPPVASPLIPAVSIRRSVGADVRWNELGQAHPRFSSGSVRISTQGYRRLSW